MRKSDFEVRNRIKELKEDLSQKVTVNDPIQKMINGTIESFALGQIAGLEWYLGENTNKKEVD